MKISVITVAYKSPDILQKSIDSFFKYNDLGSEIEYILVDNSPEDERVSQKLSEETLQKIIYIPTDNNGFGAGNNIGVSVAKGEIIAFINPDIIFIEPIFSKVYNKFRENNQLGMMGGKLLYDDLSSGFSYYYDYQYSFVKKWTIKLCNRINYFNPKKMYISGANIFIRKDLFVLSGLFDENIFMYYEEPDLTRRLNKLGDYVIEYDKKIKMIHLERKSTPNGINSVKYEFESALYYGKKYNLNYNKKIIFEYHYLLLKMSIYKYLNKEKYESLKLSCEYLNNNFFKKGAAEC